MNRLAFAAAGIALLAILTPLSRPLGAQQGRDETTFTWSGQARQANTLVIRNGNGPITVKEGSGDRVQVEAVKHVRSRGSVRDVAFDVRETDGQVEICTLYDRQSSCRDRSGTHDIRVSVDYTLLVPRSVHLRLLTGNGQITIDGGGAEVTATTGNGEVRIGETEGHVAVTTGNGDVRVDGAHGPVTVTTGNGRVFVTTANGAVDATTGNGDIDVRIKSLPPGGSMESDMRVNTGLGTVRVSLPNDFNGRIDASSGNGTLRSDFEISIVGRLDAHHVRGTIGRGGPLLQISTGNGMIELRKN